MSEEYPYVELLRMCVEEIVDNPDEVEIKREMNEQGVVLNLQVNQEDAATVIGKEGRTINAIRHLVRTSGLKEKAWVSVKVLTD